MKRRRLSVALTMTCALAFAETLAGCKPKGPDGPPPPSTPPPVPVSIAEAMEKDVPIVIDAVGSVQAYATVSVRAVVGGTLTDVPFVEGQMVKTTDLLAQVDRRPLEASLRVSEANLARDTAALAQADATKAQREASVKEAEAVIARQTVSVAQARREEGRYKTLSEKQLVAGEDFDKLQTTSSITDATLKANRAALDSTKAAVRAALAAIDSAKAALTADQAAIDSVKLQLSYTEIRSPIDGRIGGRLVPAGNVIKANDEALAVITQVRPIYVAFSVPESRLGEVISAIANKPVVEVRRPGETKVIATGVLTFINNTVDATTGTISVKATFTNDDDALWPGQYVDVTLKLASKHALTVPSEAVQIGQNGTFVFVVQPDNTVDVRLVTAGPRIGGDALIEGGLTAKERVVTDGQSKLRKGAAIRPPAPPGATPPTPTTPSAPAASAPKAPAGP